MEKTRKRIRFSPPPVSEQVAPAPEPEEIDSDEEDKPKLYYIVDFDRFSRSALRRTDLVTWMDLYQMYRIDNLANNFETKYRIQSLANEKDQALVWVLQHFNEDASPKRFVEGRPGCCPYLERFNATHCHMPLMDHAATGARPAPNLLGRLRDPLPCTLQNQAYFLYSSDAQSLLIAVSNHFKYKSTRPNRVKYYCKLKMIRSRMVL